MATLQVAAKTKTLRKLANLVSPVPADIDVAQAATLVPIRHIAAACGLTEEDYEPYGHYKAKINDKIAPRLRAERGEGYSSSSRINPTLLGEGKSTTTIGLAQAMGAHLDKNCVACIRQPSMAHVRDQGRRRGRGVLQVILMEEMNLHLTGDIHAIGVANNLRRRRRHPSLPRVDAERRGAVQPPLPRPQGRDQGVRRVHVPGCENSAWRRS